MKVMVEPKLQIVMIVLLLAVLASGGPPAEPTSFYSFNIKDINGNEYGLDRLKGTVSLVVNVASKCGYTDSHYKQLKKIHEALGWMGFQVLAFPCNQFGQQEPGTNQEILDFANTKYLINFPMFAKVDVVGEKQSPAYQFLINQSQQEPTWNFWKYLVDGEGKVVGAWGPKTSVDAIYADVQKLVEKNQEIRLKKFKADL